MICRIFKFPYARTRHGIIPVESIDTEVSTRVGEVCQVTVPVQTHRQSWGSVKKGKTSTWCSAVFSF